MAKSETYEYAFLRFVPIVEREEFMNIGVILYSRRNQFLELKYIIDTERLKVLSPDQDFDIISEHLHSWDLICQGDLKAGPIASTDQSYRFRWITAPKSTIIQCSKVHPGLCDDPQKVLNDLFEKYVLTSQS